ncbi:bifunctional acetate--CoA ligase family protein/GNAT family N-acetyltransferase [Caldichromatium japonicum]|uniref:Bifunctional acetate--CoA ligase family protein/GNAT family N-acetyltransferase n=1 Tax=Caldichromatium japonicum TaxID=2699430 RepID=A0A6G7VB53_9GAMM|nr:bifunctional acetate--CoA ligase family protein/GNAT family N-acetyltransferase [Caldichromatium japonicum]QIK37105.1 bifunctional acetate--CoA ligase family protein/GNAT family N-acetyltransferase [Caldichromatium japonicum]
MRLTDIDQLFTPTAVAVFGASEQPTSIGGLVFRNLLAGGYKGQCYAVNPKYAQILDHPCYKHLSEIDKQIDLALIAIPADQVPAVLDQCGSYGVKAAVVYSAGFAERGEIGLALQERMVEAARRNRIRVMGPNCLGVIRPQHALNASVAEHLPRRGNVALVSQSGAICTAMIDWAESRGVGFSVVVSLGAAADVDFGDVLDYLALDPQTQCILLYVEGVRNARHFMSGLRAAARIKPVVVVKAGRHPAGTRAIKSHTGGFVGSAEVFRAVTERAGVVQVGNLEQLFAAAQVFGARRRLHGDRIAIITNGGGPGVLAADRAVELGLRLATLSDKTRQTLEQVLPDHWSHGNPIDIIGDATPERYRAALTACLADPEVDGVLCIFSPLVFADPLTAAQQVVEATRDSRKPVLACWMGGERVQEARTLLSQQNLPHFDSPETAIEALSFLAAHQRNQKLLMQSPAPLSYEDPPDVEGARLIIEGVMAEGRKVLGTVEAKAILAAFRIPTMQAILTRTPNEALMSAESLGLPVVMKISSPDLEHKSDVDGVRLNIDDAQSVRRTFTEILERARRLRPEARLDGVTVERMVATRAARELMIAVFRDKIFGPVIAFGAGGATFEILGDRALALPPLNAFIIETLIDHTRIARLMGAFQHMPPMNRVALARILQRVSEMVCELPEIIAMDINPLIGNDKEVIAVDVRIKVDYRPPQLPPYGHMAIHPYPSHLIECVQLPDGRDLIIRPIRPEDAEMEQAFVRGLSEQTKYFRFMQAIKELTPEMLVRFTQIDYDREMALIGVMKEGNAEIEVGVARYMGRPGGESCEFAIVVSDQHRNLGIGSRLMRSLMQNARSRGFRTMEGDVLAVNTRMLALVKSLGFRIENDPQDPALKRVIKVL